MSTPGTVEVGQVWVSCDKRDFKRRIRVIQISGTHADVERIGPTGRPADVPANGRPAPTRSRIRLDRFRPGSTGYRLVEG